MRHTLILVKKEIKELLTRQLLIPIIVMVFFFSFIGRLMNKEYKKAINPKPIIVADLDKSQLSNFIINILNQRNLIVTELTQPLDSLIKFAQSSKTDVVLILPESLEAKFKLHKQPTIAMYTLINNLSPFADIGTSLAKSAITLINESLGVQVINQYIKEAPIATIRNPINVINYVSIRNQIINANPIAIKNAIRTQTLFIPVILLIVIVYISQMVATAIGQEKENKTLETLLTFPVSRFQILFSKMLGASIVAILLSAMFLVGMKFYLTPMNQPTSSPITALATGNNIFPSQTILYILLAISLFLAILCAASLSTLLSLFATDAKQAQVVITPINILAIFPYFVVLLLDINSLSVFLKIILYLIPFTYPFIMSQAYFFKQTSLIIGGLVYMVIFVIGITLIAAKIFSSDLIFTAKIKIRKS
ncbi:MAG: ABC transporter permease [candidate division WOR-3 bacterium]|nr:ABC transporter permease [candidate division WOR-3 bacterium]